MTSAGPAASLPICSPTHPSPAGLAATLNEFRQTAQQLQRLQSHEVRRLQAVERDTSGRPLAAAAAAYASTAPGASSDAGTAAADVSASGSPVAGTAQSSGGASPAAAGSPQGAAAAAARQQPSAQGLVAVRLAEQLEDVAGGADSGLLAEAAVALRQLSMRDAELVAAQRVRDWRPGLVWCRAASRCADCSRLAAHPPPACR